jgi:hypothetical protein
MGHTEAADLLQETLEEEAAADEKLTGLAEGGINDQAAEAAHPDDDDETAMAQPASRSKAAGKGRKTAKKSRR